MSNSEPKQRRQKKTEATPVVAPEASLTTNQQDLPKTTSKRTTLPTGLVIVNH